MDIADEPAVRRVLALHRPWAVVNAAGRARVAAVEIDGAERALCFRDNTLGARTLAALCAEQGVRLATFSSDRVFDGPFGRAYVESDVAKPRCTFGQSQHEAERTVRQLLPTALVVRTSACFGPWDQHNFVHRLARALSAGERVSADTHCAVSPTYVPDLVHAVLDLLLDGEHGLWHIANRGAMTWYDWACAAAEAIGLRADLIDAVPAGAAANTALATERGQVLPALDDALARFVREREVLA